MESILNSIKKLLGIAEDYTTFDNDLIIYINSIFPILYQLGIGSGGFFITDSSKCWNDYVPKMANNNLSNIQTYIYLRVKLLFDPPANSFVLTSINEMIKELEWRINATIENDSGGII